MICSRCGAGNVLWMGPLVALTHTECGNCGGTNCQVLDDPEPDEDEKEPESGGGMGFHIVPLPVRTG